MAASVVAAAIKAAIRAKASRRTVAAVAAAVVAVALLPAAQNSHGDLAGGVKGSDVAEAVARQVRGGSALQIAHLQAARRRRRAAKKLREMEASEWLTDGDGDLCFVATQVGAGCSGGRCDGAD